MEENKQELTPFEKRRDTVNLFATMAMVISSFATVFVAYKVGTDDNVEKASKINLDTKQVDINASNKEKESLLKVIENENKNSILQRENWKMEIEQVERRNELRYLDKSLQGSKLLNSTLVEKNDSLADRYRHIGGLLNTAQIEMKYLGENLKSLRKEKDFFIYSYSLYLLRNHQMYYSRYNAIDTLVAGLLKGGEISKEITDSLLISQNSNDYSWGLSNFVLYAGTRKTVYRDKILDEISNKLHRSLETIPYDEIFQIEHWTTKDLEIITRTLLESLAKTKNVIFKETLIRTIAEIDNLETNFHLYEVDFSGFLNYINECYLLSKDVDFAGEIQICLSIICPQIYLTRNYTYFADSFKEFAKVYKKGAINITDEGLSKLQKVRTLVAHDDYFENNEIEKFKQQIYTGNKEPKSIKLSKIKSENKKIFDYWQRVFEGKPDVNLTNLRTKLYGGLM